MLFLIQVLKMLDQDQTNQFIGLFDDLEVDALDLGYDGCENELVESMLFEHFDIEMSDDNQINMLTDIIMKYQGRISTVVELTKTMVA